jgi:hypothetical protein
MKRIITMFVVAMSAFILTAVAAFADSSAGYTLEGVLTGAGITIVEQFGMLVTILVPICVGIAVTGLGIYAIKALFTLAKGMFSTATKGA